MRSQTKEYMIELIMKKREMLLLELTQIDKGSVEGYKRWKEIQWELELTRDAILTIKY